jgi:hypothetical protein
MAAQERLNEMATWYSKDAYYDLGDALKDPASVTSLRLNGRGLTAIPPDVSKLVNLVELDLSGNEITDAGSAVPALAKLEKLNLSNNRLTSVPSGICQLKALKGLNLSSNRIASGSLGCLTSLEWVYLNNNSLTAVPDGLTGINTLKAVYLYSNQLTTLPPEFAKLPKLTTLLVQFNQIAEEPVAYSSTGIINYMFKPQLISTRHLYKYMNSLVWVQGTPVFDLETRLQLPQTDQDGTQMSPMAEARPFVNKWERMGKFISYRFGMGWGTHRYERKADANKEFGLFAAFEVEYGGDKQGMGVYFSFLSNYVYDNSNPIIDGSRRGVGTVGYETIKTGFLYKYYMAPLSSKVRPYAKGCVGLNFESGIPDQYKSRLMNIQARVGVDAYVFRFLGFNLETGFGGNNFVTGSVIIRIPFRKKS